MKTNLTLSDTNRCFLEHFHQTVGLRDQLAFVNLRFELNIECYYAQELHGIDQLTIVSHEHQRPFDYYSKL